MQPGRPPAATATGEPPVPEGAPSSKPEPGAKGEASAMKKRKAHCYELPAGEGDRAALVVALTEEETQLVGTLATAPLALDAAMGAPPPAGLSPGPQLQHAVRTPPPPPPAFARLQPCLPAISCRLQLLFLLLTTQRTRSPVP